MNAHPASEVFPMMESDRLLALAEDIRAHGLKHPIITYEGLVLDGRNRERACALVGIEPRYEEWSPDGQLPTEFVVSENLHRRDLTKAQRAAIALALLPRLETEAKERQGARTDQTSSQQQDEVSYGRSTRKAAELVGIGHSTVETAKAIQQRDPDVVERMRSGEIPTVAAAAREVGFVNDDRAGLASDTVHDVRGRAMPRIHYGKGDHFDEAVEPLRRYLKGWQSRDYAFRHINPKEARRRLKLLDEILVGTQAAYADLSDRSHEAKLRF